MGKPVKDGSTDFRQAFEKSDSVLLKKFIPQGADFVSGKLLENDSAICVIYGSIGHIAYFYLYTYNKSGMVLDSTALHGPCGEDEYLGLSTYATIDPDGLITRADTLKFYVVDTLSANYKRTLDESSPKKALM